MPMPMASSESSRGGNEQPGAGSAALKLFRRFGGSGFGRRLCSWLICRQAPYFSSISPLLEILEPGRCVASIQHRRRVQNHIGTVHAIALCNLAEFVGGLATDAAMTRSLRWIPKGMAVRYLKKAVGPMRGEAILDPIGDIGTGAERSARVVVKDRNSEVVFDAQIAMWVSPKRTDARNS
jgi:acyl-coenzyme A thioesterase PaaI-like protein